MPACLEGSLGQLPCHQRDCPCCQRGPEAQASLPVRTSTCDCICEFLWFSHSGSVSPPSLSPHGGSAPLLLPTSHCGAWVTASAHRAVEAGPSSLWLSDSLPIPLSAGFLSLPSGRSQPPAVSCRVSASSFLSCPHPRPSLGLLHLNWVSVHSRARRPHQHSAPPRPRAQCRADTSGSSGKVC